MDKLFFCPMCGRFSIYSSLKAIKEEFSVEEIEESLVSGHLLKPNYNVAPSHHIPVVLRESPNSLQLLRWGLIPFWSKDPKIGSRMINARAETITEKPSFRNLIKAKRCIIPANGFFEWKKDASGKRPRYIFLKDKQLMGFAGLWDGWESPEGKNIRSCTIITTTANDLIKEIHDRMPVILRNEDYGRWLGDNEDDRILRGLLKPFNADEMGSYPVTAKINIPSFNSEDCIKRL